MQCLAFPSFPPLLSPFDVKSAPIIPPAFIQELHSFIHSFALSFIHLGRVLDPLWWCKVGGAGPALVKCPV
jgi:hypothetical protein